MSNNKVIYDGTQPQTITLPGGGRLIYEPHFLSKLSATRLYNHLDKSANWIQGVYKMFGKDIPTPRLLWAMRDEGSDITKSYKVTGSSVWTKRMVGVKRKVEKKIDAKLLYAQLNYYRDNSDYIGWHTDSEVQPDDLIASISLGQPRKFQFRRIDRSGKIHEIVLGHGSLLIMDEMAAKGLWKHRLPKTAVKLDGRINITFRNR